MRLKVPARMNETESKLGNTGYEGTGLNAQTYLTVTAKKTVLEQHKNLSPSRITEFCQFWHDKVERKLYTGIEAGARRCLME